MNKITQNKPETDNSANSLQFDKNWQEFDVKITKAFNDKYGILIPFTYSMGSIPFALNYDRLSYNIEEEYKKIIKEIWG